MNLDKLLGRRRVHYLHIGKTGGTAVKAALEAAAAPRRIRLFLHPHKVTLQDIPVNESCFFFVRDPLNRFVSGFYSRQRQGRPRHNWAWTPDEEAAFKVFPTPNALAVSLSSEDEALRQAAADAMNSIRHVRDSLWRWLVDEEYLRSRRESVLFVGSQEHLEQDFASLTRMLGISAELPNDEVHAHRNPTHLDRRLEETAIKNLRNWYERDYACLDLLGSWFPNLPTYSGESAGPPPQIAAEQPTVAPDP